MGWIESALRQLTQRVEYLYRWMADQVAQQNNTRQQLLAAFQAQGGGSGGSAAIFVCVPSAGIAAATGVPGSGSPTALTGQTIYQISSGSYITVTTNGTVYNPYLSAVVSGKVCTLGPNGDGTYTVLGQSCT